MRVLGLGLLASIGASGQDCTLPAGTEGADDGNPHCWDRKRRCDGPNAHPDAGPGYSPACGLCEGIGGIVWSDAASDITIPKCTPIATADAVSPAPQTPEWGSGNGGKFTITNDRFIMIGKKTDPFCFKFFPSNNSVGNQCYRRQTGKLYYDMSEPVKTIRYDLDIRIPWPSDEHSLFGNITTMIAHRGPNMWIVNDLYFGVKQCICTQPLSAANPGVAHNKDPIFPVMFNWTNNMKYLGREEIEVEYGVGPLQLEHWIYGPHHAWTKVGDNKIVRMYQPYNGFEVFVPGAFVDGIADPKVFDDISPPPQCKKGGAMARINCDDHGMPIPKEGQASSVSREPASSGDLQRARAKVPRSTHKGKSFADMAEKLNSFVRAYGNSKECREWSAQELQKFQATLLLMRAPEMDDVYSSTSDRRQLRGNEEEHGSRWERLSSLASALGGVYEDMHRDGHCHEAVMWFTHHISEPVRRYLAEMLPIPTLPGAAHDCQSRYMDQDQKQLCDEYMHQVSCQDCHADSTAPAESIVV